MLHAMSLAAAFLSLASNSEARIPACGPTREFSVAEGADIAVAVGIGDAQYFQVRHDQRTFLIRDRAYHAPLLVRSPANEFRFHVGALKGRFWTDDGREVEAQVFDGPGRYTLYFADNLDTEPDNAASCSIVLDVTATQSAEPK